MLGIDDGPGSKSCLKLVSSAVSQSAGGKQSAILLLASQLFTSPPEAQHLPSVPKMSESRRMASDRSDFRPSKGALISEERKKRILSGKLTTTIFKEEALQSRRSLSKAERMALERTLMNHPATQPMQRGTAPRSSSPGKEVWPIARAYDSEDLSQPSEAESGGEDAPFVPTALMSPIQSRSRGKTRCYLPSLFSYTPIRNLSTCTHRHAFKVFMALFAQISEKGSTCGLHRIGTTTPDP